MTTIILSYFVINLMILLIWFIDVMEYWTSFPNEEVYPLRLFLTALKIFFIGLPLGFLIVIEWFYNHIRKGHWKTKYKKDR